MSTTAFALAALVLVVMAVASAALIVFVRLGTRTRRGVVVTPNEDRTEFAIRTPLGRASARLVIHDYQGKVYEVHTYFRGEQPAIGYVPPSETLLTSFIQREVDEAQDRRAAVARNR